MAVNSMINPNGPQRKPLPACWLLRGLWLLIYMLSTAPAFSHGAGYELLAGGVVGVRASFDSGQPMAYAPVLIFPPGETQPQLTTSTDSRGVVCFAPDRAGIWVLQVRAEGGHGLRINLDVEESMLSASAAGSTGGFSNWQKLAMAACVLWGFAATALFFRRRKEQ